MWSSNRSQRFFREGIWSSSRACESKGASSSSLMPLVESTPAKRSAVHGNVPRYRSWKARPVVIDRSINLAICLHLLWPTPDIVFHINVNQIKPMVSRKYLRMRVSCKANFFVMSGDGTPIKAWRKYWAIQASKLDYRAI